MYGVHREACPNKPVQDQSYESWKKSQKRTPLQEWCDYMAYHIKDIWSSITAGIHMLPKRLGRSLSWAVFMFKNDDWYWEGLYQVMEKKMLELAHAQEHSSHVNGKKYAKHIRKILTYMHTGMDNDFTDPLYLEFTQKYGDLTMRGDKPGAPCKDGQIRTSVCEMGFKKKDKTIWEGQAGYKKINKLYHRMRRKVETRRVNAKHKFFSELEKWIEYWWD